MACGFLYCSKTGLCFSLLRCQEEQDKYKTELEIHYFYLKYTFNFKNSLFKRGYPHF